MAAPQHPRTAPVILPADLSSGDPEQVVRGDTRECEEYDLASVAGREVSHTTFRECRLTGSLDESTELRGVHLVESVLTDLTAPVFAASLSSWRDVELSSSRLGSAELYESQWRSVVVTGCKLGYVNARWARWQDVSFQDCVIEELDLASATLQRVDFAHCEIATLDLAHATLADVDFRGVRLATVTSLDGLAGAWLRPDQLLDLLPQIAGHLKVNLA